MAPSREDQRARYPLAAYNFRVTVDGTTMRFAKVSGLEREYETLTYRHGLSFIEGEQIAKHYISKYVSITLEQGTVAGSRALHEWLERKTKSVMEVSLCDEQGMPVLAWRIAKALPIKLSAASFDAQTNEVAIDTLEIKAAGITIVHLA
jgi:phage tail-like protein